MAASQVEGSARSAPVSAAPRARRASASPAMPPKAMRASAIAPPSSVRRKAPSHRGDVLVEALGDLVARKIWLGRSFGTVTAGDELARLAVLLAVVDEELLERQRSRVLALAQLQRRVRARSAPAACRRSASRWRCCRRRCRWPAPASSRGGAAARRDRGRSAVSDCGAPRRRWRRRRWSIESPVSAMPVRSPRAAEMDDLRQVAQLLGDPQADIGRAGDQHRVGMARHRARRGSRRWPVRQRMTSSSPMKTSLPSARMSSDLAVLAAARSVGIARQFRRRRSIAASTIGR